MDIWKGTWVIIPAWNEEKSIQNVIENLRELPLEAILVIDDGSADQTAEISRKLGAKVVSHPINLGVGAAVRTGLAIAQNCGAKRVVQVDADGQHSAKAVQNLLEIQNIDLVIGARDWNMYRISATKKLAIRIIILILKNAGIQNISDPTSGFRAFSTKAIKLYSTEMPTHFLSDTVEALIIGFKFGLTHKEIRVSMNLRQEGKPSHVGLKLLSSLLGIFLRILVLPFSNRGNNA